MEIKVHFAKLHNPLFLAGTNHGDRLQQGIKDIDLTWLSEHKILLVKFNKQVAFVPETNVSSWIPANPKEALELYTGNMQPAHDVEPPKRGRPTHKSHPMKLDINQAQVSDPTRGMK